MGEWVNGCVSGLLTCQEGTAQRGGPLFAGESVVTPQGKGLAEVGAGG